MPCTQPLDNMLPQVPSMVVEGEVEFAKPVKTTAQILHDGSNVMLPPGGSMDSVVASTSKFDWLAASCKETSVVMSTVSVQPGASLGPAFSDTSVVLWSAKSQCTFSFRPKCGGKLGRRQCIRIMAFPEVDILYPVILNVAVEKTSSVTVVNSSGGIPYGAAVLRFPAADEPVPGK